jgi:hypothetical protein
MSNKEVLYKLHSALNNRLAALVPQDDEPNHTSDPKWNFNEGYYYGILDAINLLEGKPLEFEAIEMWQIQESEDEL